MSPNDYNERFYHLVRRESFYAKRLSAMNEEICEAFLNISRFLIDEGYVSNNAREVDNIVEALPEQALINMFEDETFATKFKIALKAVNPRLSENALSGEKRQAAAIALRLLEYSKNNATYLRPGCKAPEKDAEGPAGEYNPRGRKKRPAGGSGATDASLKGDVTQTNEDVEQVDENRRAARSAGGYKDDSKKQTDPSKEGFTGISGSIKDIMRQNREIEARKKKKKTNEETEVEEGYKPIGKKKEAAMYRRAGNLARTSLSSRGKKKEEAQTKSAKIVSAISSQKERERFAKMGDEKARDNYNEAKDQSTVDNTPTFNDDKAKPFMRKGHKPASVAPVEEQMTTQTQFPPLKSSGSTGNPNATPPAPDLRRNRNTDQLPKRTPANAANVQYYKDSFDIDHLLDDVIFDELTEEELLHFAFDIFEEMEEEGILAEATEYFEDVLLEDRYADASATSKKNAREIRKKKVVGALKTAAGAAKKAGSAAAGRAAEMAKKAPGAVKKGAETAGRAVGAAARGGASLAKRAAVKGAAAAGEVAGAAKGGYEAGRIKAKREAMAKTKPQAKSSDDGDKTKGKLDSLLKDVRGGEKKKPAASGGGSSSGGGSDEGTKTRKRGLLRRLGSAVKRGLKKAVGKSARAVSNVAGSAAERLGEDTQFDIILDYLLEHEVCTLDEAEEVMMELTEEEVENILTEKKMTAADKKKEAALKKKYDDSGMKASMKKQYGKEEGKKIYFATIRKQAMEETILEGDNLTYKDATEVLKGHRYSQKQLMDMSKKATNTGQHGLAQACYDAACAMKGV